MAVDLLCIGEPLLEYNQLPATDDGRVLYQQGHGGDTSNVAIAAARQGAKVGYLTAIGEDPGGDSLLSLWKAEGVDTSTVKRSVVHPTGAYFVTHGPDGHRFTYHRRGSAASMLAVADIPEATIASARLVFASGISQGISESAADAIFHAFAVARKHGVAVAYDTNYRPALWPPLRAAAVIHAAICQTDVAMPGLEDAKLLTGLEDPEAILDFYLGLGPGLVVLKMGEQGGLCRDAPRDGSVSRPSPLPPWMPPALATPFAAPCLPGSWPASRTRMRRITPPPPPPSRPQATERSRRSPTRPKSSPPWRCANR